MEIKRITLHPLLEDGTVDLNVNLYPKTLLRGIVDDTGEEVEVALTSDIPTDVVSHQELADGLAPKATYGYVDSYVSEHKGTKLYVHRMGNDSEYYGWDWHISVVSTREEPYESMDVLINDLVSNHHTIEDAAWPLQGGYDSDFGGYSELKVVMDDLGSGPILALKNYAQEYMEPTIREDWFFLTGDKIEGFYDEVIPL